MFFHHTGNGRKTILIMNVNDIKMTEDDPDEIERLKKTLSIKFEVKNFG